MNNSNIEISFGHILSVFLAANRIWHYYITPEGIINVDSDVILNNLGPHDRSVLSYIKFGTISGDLIYISNTNTSVEWFPDEVGGLINVSKSGLVLTPEVCDVLFKYKPEQIVMTDSDCIEYYNYYRIRKRTETINELLNE
jgi:hypothetical protein